MWPILRKLASLSGLDVGPTSPVRVGRSAENVPGVWSGVHVGSLDGLRGLAVVGVLAFHDRRLRGGWLGVDLFFTLSGFLITSLLVAEVHRCGGVSFSDFWRRRARRLLPAAVALVGVLVIWGQIGPEPPWVTSDLRGAALASLTYVANWYQAFAGGGYWDIFGATPSPLLHTWSLAIEEQFYLVFPLVVWACARTSRRPVHLLMVVCGCGWLASVVATLVLGAHGDANRVYLGTDTRVGSVLIGAVLACVLALRPAASARPHTREADLSAVGALALLAVMWATTSGDGRFVARGGLTLHAVAVAVVVAVVVRYPGSIASRVLGLRPLVLLGTISYGLYLWHWPVFLYVDQRLTLSPLAATGVKVGASLALATVSYFWLEQPVRLRGLAAVGGLAPALGVVAVVVLGTALLPSPERVESGAALASAPTSLSNLRPLPKLSENPKADEPTPTTAAPTSTTEPKAKADEPEIVFATEPTVTTSVLARPGRVAGPVRLLILGDSVPFLLGEALVAHQDEFKLVVGNRALPACSAAGPEAERIRGHLLPNPGDCAGLWANDAQAFDPDVVVVSLNGDVGVEMSYGGVWGRTCAPAYAESFTRRVKERLGAFTARGARVVLLTPILMQEPYFRLRGSGEARDCLTALEHELAKDLAGVTLVQFGEWVCPDDTERCRVSLGGVDVSRQDGLHFTGDKAIVVWRLMLPVIQRAVGLGP